MAVLFVAACAVFLVYRSLGLHDPVYIIAGPGLLAAWISWRTSSPGLPGRVFETSPAVESYLRRCKRQQGFSLPTHVPNLLGGNHRREELMKVFRKRRLDWYEPWLTENQKKAFPSQHDRGARSPGRVALVWGTNAKQGATCASCHVLGREERKTDI